VPTRFFYDSYAVLAFTSGSQAYREYFGKNDGVLMKLNLLEVFCLSLEQFGFKAASDISGTL
jgi:hypothetical protein